MRLLANGVELEPENILLRNFNRFAILITTIRNEDDVVLAKDVQMILYQIAHAVCRANFLVCHEQQFYGVLRNDMLLYECERCQNTACQPLLVVFNTAPVDDAVLLNKFERIRLPQRKFS